MKARESTLSLVPLLAKFQLSATSAPPPLPQWIGPCPPLSQSDEEDMAPIGGVDEDEGKTLEEEMTVLSDTKAQDLTVRFKKTADGVYVEAKRGAIGGVTQVPLYFYALLLALGWNEIVAGKHSPCHDMFGLNTPSWSTFSLAIDQQCSEIPYTSSSSSCSASGHTSPTL